MADNDEGEGTTYTQEQFDAAMAQRDADEVGLKANSEKLIAETKQAKEALRVFDGIDPKEHKALKKAAVEADRKKAEDEGDWEALEAKLVEHHGKDMDALKAVHGTETDTLRTELTDAQGSIEQLLIDRTAISEIADAGGLTKVLLPHVKAHSRVVKNGEGKYTVQVVDASGTERVTDGKGTKMTIKDLVSEMRQDPDFARNFEGSGSSGGGSSKSSGGAGGAGSVAAGDKQAFLSHVEDIATGKVEVTT